MWKWKEKWFGEHVCLYLAGGTSLNKKTPYFGFNFELTTSRFELFVGFFGVLIEW